MAEMVTTQIVVGDKVRVHFHPPGLMKSFCEGVVRRVNVTTPEGHFFVVEVAHEVLLDREHRIRPGFEDYVRHECPNDFPGRIELLSTAENNVEMEPASDLLSEEPPDVPQHEVAEQEDEARSVDLEVHSGPEAERLSEVATDCELTQVDVEPQPVRRQRGLMAALFARKR
jgi:hypothetical protein